MMLFENLRELCIEIETIRAHLLTSFTLHHLFLRVLAQVIGQIGVLGEQLW